MQQATSWDLRSMISYPSFLVILALFTLFWLAVIMVPYGKLLKRTGHSPVWCIVFAIPLVNVVALWFFAFKPWPTDTAQPLAPVTPVNQQ